MSRREATIWVGLGYPKRAVAPRRSMCRTQPIWEPRARLTLACPRTRRGFGFGVFHVGVRVPAVVDHVVGPVVDPLPFPLVAAHVQVVVPRGCLDTVEVSGLDRFLVWEVEQVVVHMFV